MIASPGDVPISAVADEVADRLESRLAEKQRVLDLEAAALYLGMSCEALKHRAGRDIPCLAGERERRRLRFDRRDLDRWIAKQPREGCVET